MTKENVKEPDNLTKFTELLESHPDISVLRDDMGDIIVFQERKGKKTNRINLHLSRDTQDQIYPDVGISVVEDGSNKYSYIKARPTEKGMELIDVKLQKGVGTKEILEKSKCGLELFTALLGVHPKDRGVYNWRAYDYLGASDPEITLLRDSTPEIKMLVLRQLQSRFLTSSLGFTDTTPSYQNKYRYMQEVLGRPVVLSNS